MILALPSHSQPLCLLLLRIYAAHIHPIQMIECSLIICAYGDPPIIYIFCATLLLDPICM